MIGVTDDGMAEEVTPVLIDVLVIRVELNSVDGKLLKSAQELVSMTALELFVVIQVLSVLFGLKLSHGFDVSIGMAAIKLQWTASDAHALQL